MSEADIQPAGAGQWQLRGILDFATVPALAIRGTALLREQAAAGVTRLQIDLTGVDQANSVALALLLEWLEVAAGLGVVLRYHGLPQSLQRIAAISNLLPLVTADETPA